MDIKELLARGMEEYGIKHDDTKINQLMKYKVLLQEWNEKMNLTAIVDDEGIIKKHFIDSLSIVATGVIKEGMSLIDVGTGAGFPGIPLKIVMPEINVLLLDSLNKRINFLNAVVDELGLKNISTVHARAEELSRKEEYRERFDIATARAVANMTVLSEYCIPYVKVGGYFIAMKGPSGYEELEAAEGAITVLGGNTGKIIETKILDEDIKHNVIIVEKTKNTPSKYPRKVAQMEKNPIK